MSWNTVNPRYRQLAEQHLTPKQLRVLQLRLDGHSWPRIATALDISQSTARSHFNAAIRRLRQHLRKDAA